jgi:hypothetical protein
MKLDCIVSACNMTPLYCDFIPPFIKAWKTLYPNVDIRIILINDILPSELRQYAEYIILFTPLPGVSTSLTSQYIRLLYPCILNYENGIMITDIDMLPMNSKYYTKNIEPFDNSKFIYLRNVCFEYDEIAMCYNVGLRQTWENIFNIHSLDDIKARLIDVSSKNVYLEGHGNIGWNTDQKDFFKNVLEWNKRTNNFVYLDDNKTGYMRLDRIHRHTMEMPLELQNAIKDGAFSDYHCLRPYSQYKDLNDYIVSLLKPI